MTSAPLADTAPATRYRSVAPVAAAMTAATAFSAFPSPFYQDYAEVLGGGAWPTALLFSVHGAAVAAVMALVGTARCGRLIARLTPTRVLAAALLLDAAAGLLYLAPPHLATLITARAVTGIALGLITPVATTLLTAHPRGTSIATACILGGVGAGAFCAGSLAALGGHRATAFSAGIATLLTTATTTARHPSPTTSPPAAPTAPVPGASPDAASAASAGPASGASVGPAFAGPVGPASAVSAGSASGASVGPASAVSAGSASGASVGPASAVSAGPASAVSAGPASSASGGSVAGAVAGAALDGSGSVFAGPGSVSGLSGSGSVAPGAGVLVVAGVAAFVGNGVLGLFTSVLPGEVAAATGWGGSPVVAGGTVGLVMVSAGVCRLLVGVGREVGAVLTGGLFVLGGGALAAGWGGGSLWLSLLGGVLLGGAAGLCYAAAIQAASAGRAGAARLTGLARVQLGGQLGLIFPVLLYAAVT